MGQFQILSNAPEDGNSVLLAEDKDFRQVLDPPDIRDRWDAQNFQSMDSLFQLTDHQLLVFRQELSENEDSVMSEARDGNSLERAGTKLVRWLNQIGNVAFRSVHDTETQGMISENIKLQNGNYVTKIISAK